MRQPERAALPSPALDGGKGDSTAIGAAASTFLWSEQSSTQSPQAANVGYIPNRLAASITSRIVPVCKFYNAVRASKDQFHLACNKFENTIRYNNCSRHDRAARRASALWEASLMPMKRRRPIGVKDASHILVYLAAIPSRLDATRRSPTNAGSTTLDCATRVPLASRHKA